LSGKVGSSQGPPVHWALEPPRLCALHYIANNLRAQDLKEVLGLGSSPLPSLVAACAGEGESFVFSLDGKSAAACGVGWVEADQVARPWFLGTDDIFPALKLFYTAAPAWVDRWVEMYGYLENFCHSDNTVSKKWLRNLDFTFDGQGFVLGQHTYERFFKCASLSP